MIYLYALYARPAGIGCLPADYVEILPRPAVGGPYADVARHGIACYERELSAEEVKAFELPQLLPPDRFREAAQLAVKDMEKYARGYLEMASSDPTHFMNVVRDQVRVSWPGHPPVISDFGPVIAMVVERLQQVQAAKEADSKRSTRELDASQWFALTHEGALVSLGKQLSFDDAEAEAEKMGLQAIWILDQPTAQSWQSVISNNLTGASATPVQRQSNPGMPRVLVTVRGGIADWVSDDGVEVETFDFDNCAHCSGNVACSSKLPAHFADLAQRVNAPYDGDGADVPGDM